MPNFCIGIKQANKSTHASLQEKGGVILSGADDTYILGPPQIAVLDQEGVLRDVKMMMENVI